MICEWLSACQRIWFDIEIYVKIMIGIIMLLFILSWIVTEADNNHIKGKVHGNIKSIRKLRIRKEK
jgi:hypothetical protein